MPELEGSIKLLSERVKTHASSMATEEAAKTSVILPFLQSLGFDVFNPAEVIPEYTADAVGKKGEKVDYALCIDGEIKILIECKGLATQLESKQLSQLFRYFTVTNAKFGILTNGRNFQFYSDLDEPNKLDKKPFFTFDLLAYSQFDVAELKKFQKSAFDVDGILANAERLKYISAIKNYLTMQMEEPSETFVKALASEVHEGRVTAHVRATMTSAIKTAFKEVIRDAVQARLSNALQSSSEHDASEDSGQDEDATDIVTTDEEIEGMLIIRAIVRDTIDGSRVGLRDAKSYCAILIDDNNRKPLARLHFNSQKKYIGLFEGKNEERVHITDLGEIYNYADRLRATAKAYCQEG